MSSTHPFRRAYDISPPTSTCEVVAAIDRMSLLFNDKSLNILFLLSSLRGGIRGDLVLGCESRKWRGRPNRISSPSISVQSPGSNGGGLAAQRLKCIGQYRVHVRNGTPHIAIDPFPFSLRSPREYCVDFVVCGLWSLNGASKSLMTDYL
jgi:hypothetical protein